MIFYEMNKKMMKEILAGMVMKAIDYVLSEEANIIDTMNWIEKANFDLSASTIRKQLRFIEDRGHLKVGNLYKNKLGRWGTLRLYEKGHNERVKRVRYYKRPFSDKKEKIEFHPIEYKKVDIQGDEVLMFLGYEDKDSPLDRFGTKAKFFYKGRILYFTTRYRLNVYEIERQFIHVR